MEQEQKDQQYMKQALAEARQAFARDEVPIGAVVVSGGRVIARCHNLTEALCDPTAHSEMQAITAVANALGGKYLKGCTMYVTVEPCPMCAAALYWAQLDRLVYGAADVKRGYSVVSDRLLHPKTEVVRGVLEAECAELMTTFFKKKR